MNRRSLLTVLAATPFFGFLALAKSSSKLPDLLKLSAGFAEIETHGMWVNQIWMNPIDIELLKNLPEYKQIDAAGGTWAGVGIFWGATVYKGTHLKPGEVILVPITVAFALPSEPRKLRIW